MHILCLAQNNFVEGYVVTHSGDTLKGLIDNKEPDYTVDAVNFRGEEGAEYHHLGLEVRFEWSNYFFKSMKMNEENGLMVPRK